MDAADIWLYKEFGVSEKCIRVQGRTVCKVIVKSLKSEVQEKWQASCIVKNQSCGEERAKISLFFCSHLLTFVSKLTAAIVSAFPYSFIHSLLARPCNLVWKFMPVVNHSAMDNFHGTKKSLCQYLFDTFGWFFSAVACSFFQEICEYLCFRTNAMGQKLHTLDTLPNRTWKLCKGCCRDSISPFNIGVDNRARLDKYLITLHEILESWSLGWLIIMHSRGLIAYFIPVMVHTHTQLSPGLIYRVSRAQRTHTLTH